MDARGYGSLDDLGVGVPERVGERYEVAVVVNNGAAPPSFTLTATPGRVRRRPMTSRLRTG